MSPDAAMGLPTPSSPPEGETGRTPSRSVTPDATGSGAYPRLANPQALEVVQLLVVERVVRLHHVYLPAGTDDARHVICHARGLLHVNGIGQVTVGPVEGVQAPAHTLYPHGLIRQPPGAVLAGHGDGHRAVAGGADIQPLDGPTP